MKAKNQFEKYNYYIKRRFEVFLHSLQKSQLEGRKKGPKVVLNSLPKSGTHLLESLFLNLPLMRHNGKRTLMIQTQNSVLPKVINLSTLKKGQFYLAHMQFHESIIKTAEENDIKIVHLIRDPRDVLLSHLNYVENMDITQRSHTFLASFESKLDKLKAMIKGKKNVIEPFNQVLDKFESWINHPNVLSVKFEHLIGEKGGGSKEEQYNAVKSICKFIGLEVDKDALALICESIYSPKSSTFNKGKIGNWRRALNEDEKEFINKILRNEIASYNYPIN